MASIRACPLPSGALLEKYGGDAGFADCFTTEVHRAVSHAEFVEAFYTSGLFKLERFVLKVAVSKPSTDDEVRQLAIGQRNAFAAWRVEARTADQLLLCDFGGHTRSWLMVAPGANAPSTQLYFGSAVVPTTDRAGKQNMGMLFGALLGFHNFYSRALLGLARDRIARADAGGGV